jgi:predicted alpha/beta hydrolase family esterase
MLAGMARRPSHTVPTLVLHGLGGPGPQHWYTWLAGELRTAGREVQLPVLPNSVEPVLADWLRELHDSMRRLPDTGYDLVCHSAGSLLWLHHAASAPADLPRPARVALVAIPDSEHVDPPSFRDVPLDAEAVHRAAEGTVLIAGDDDPTCPAGAAVVFGTPLKLATTLIPGGGHLNPASGYGPWPAMLDWCSRDNLAFN